MGDITVAPLRDTTIAAGGSLILNAYASGGTLLFQWKKNGASLSDGITGGTSIMGATTPQLRLSNIWPGDAGSYACVVSSPDGGRSATSGAGYLSIGPPPVVSQARLEQLQYNPKWYRTFDTSAGIVPSEGTLLYAWSYGDVTRYPDSFYVGIDTLWALPQDVNGDTANDWDLQVCPDGFCMNGLKVGVHGATAPIHFGGTGEFSDTSYQTEHHFQFFPAISPTYHFTAPANGIFGAMMYVRSLSTGISDTVFAFGTWEVPWDTLHLPPVRPVAGYLPKRSDFSIVENMVRYTH